jgi:DNA-binding transcriptional MerR regulator
MATKQKPLTSLPLLPLAALAPPAEREGGEYLQIGEVAERLGLTQRTLRYYEELGLLDPPTRMAGGFRLYSARDVARLEQVVRLKQLLGFSLAEIKTILDAQEQLSAIRSAYQADPDTAHRLAALDRAEALVRHQLAMVEQKIAQMTAMRDELREKLHRYDTLRAGLRQTPPDPAPTTT